MAALLEAERRFTGPIDEWPRFAWPRAIGAIIDEIRRGRPLGYQRRGQAPVVRSLDEPAGEDQRLADTIPDHSLGPDHSDPIAEQRLADAVAALPIEQRSLVELLVDEDRSPSELARVFGVTDTAVAHMIGAVRRQLQESLEHPLPRRRALKLLRSASYLRRSVALGRSTREIAAELGVNRTSVREWMRAHRIPPVRR